LRIRWVLLVSVVLASVGRSRIVLAAEHPTTTNQTIEDAVCDDAERASRWNLGWTIVFGAAAVGSAGVATFAPASWIDADHRAGLYVTASKASIGVVFKLLDPLEFDVAGWCPDSLPERARFRRAALADASRRERRALIPNLFGGLALNAMGLLYLGYGRGAWETAWVSFGIGSAASVASTLTAPLQSWLLKRRLDQAHHVALVPAITHDSRGIALAGTW
jgi:hypothetical protein